MVALIDCPTMTIAVYHGHYLNNDPPTTIPHLKLSYGDVNSSLKTAGLQWGGWVVWYLQSVLGGGT